jgi:hypothetical protein
VISEQGHTAGKKDPSLLLRSLPPHKGEGKDRRACRYAKVLYSGV